MRTVIELFFHFDTGVSRKIYCNINADETSDEAFLHELVRGIWAEGSNAVYSLGHVSKGQICVNAVDLARVVSLDAKYITVDENNEIVGEQ